MAKENLCFLWQQEGLGLSSWSQGEKGGQGSIDAFLYRPLSLFNMLQQTKMETTFEITKRNLFLTKK